MNKIGDYSKDKLVEQLNITTDILGLQEPSIVEKDLFVIMAIGALMRVENDTFKLVFQGGTALAKAHKFIQRMSEDCDYRIAYKMPEQARKKDAQRRLLRGFRKQLLQALVDCGFELADDAVRVRNEGQFISVKASYESIYPVSTHLKPYLALEFFLGQVKTPVVKRKVTSLIRETLGDEKHPEIEVDCMSIPETAAEKWVVLTRRIATVQQREHYYDKNLVRHIYDLAMINVNQPLKNSSFAKLVARIVEGDQIHFKTHSILFHQSPVEAIRYSLKELQNNSLWLNNWNDFMDTMVYGEKLSYAAAINNLNSLSQLALNEINDEF